MGIMNWDASLHTGHEKVDSDHKRLVDLINRLGDAMAKGQGKDVCGKVLNELVTYARTHFSTEERLMAVHDYDGQVDHKGQHERFIRDVAAFKARFDSGSAMLSISILNFLKTWLADHIKLSDKEFVAGIANGAK
jgi:hemerythrin-like metal-binding protein